MLRLSKIYIMTELGQFTSVLESRLIDIEFPGMDVKDEWHPLFVNVMKPPFDNGIRHEPEVAATGEGEVLTKQSHRGDGEFDKTL